MAEVLPPVLEEFLSELGRILSAVAGQVGFGDVRRQVSHSTLDHPITNVAIIYESPGGSTNQINIVFDHTVLQFRVLNDLSGEEELFPASAPIVGRIEQLVTSIPEIRMKRLKWDIDRWVDDGKTQSQIYLTLNRLLQFEAGTGLRGGAITGDELKEATRYVAGRFQPKE